MSFFEYMQLCAYSSFLNKKHGGGGAKQFPFVSVYICVFVDTKGPDTGTS